MQRKNIGITLLKISISVRQFGTALLTAIKNLGYPLQPQPAIPIITIRAG